MFDCVWCSLVCCLVCFHGIMQNHAGIVQTFWSCSSLFNCRVLMGSALAFCNFQRQAVPCARVWSKGPSRWPRLARAFFGKWFPFFYLFALFMNNRSAKYTTCFNQLNTLSDISAKFYIWKFKLIKSFVSAQRSNVFIIVMVSLFRLNWSHRMAIRRILTARA